MVVVNVKLVYVLFLFWFKIIKLFGGLIKGLSGVRFGW